MPNTLFTGKVYHRFDELPSTNDYAAELIAKSTPPEGTVVRADSQSAGRGQFGSRWESAAGKNLTFSIILYPDWLETGAQFYLGMAVALALRDAVVTAEGGMGGSASASRPSNENSQPTTSSGVHRSSSAVKIKWPNDLYIGDRKAGGILVQNTLSGRFLQSSVVGIGLNINQLEFGSSLPNPTSLALAFGCSFDPDDLSDRLLECLEQRYLQLKAGRRAELKAGYERHLYRSGVPARYARAGGPEFTGTIRGVDADGRLRVENESGREEIFDLKQVRFVNP